MKQQRLTYIYCNKLIKHFDYLPVFLDLPVRQIGNVVYIFYMEIKWYRFLQIFLKRDKSTRNCNGF